MKRKAQPKVSKKVAAKRKKDSVDCKSFLTSISEELLLILLQFVDTATLIKSAQCVCRHWHRLLNGEEAFWVRRIPGLPLALVQSKVEERSTYFPLQRMALRRPFERNLIAPAEGAEPRKVATTKQLVTGLGLDRHIADVLRPTVTVSEAVSKHFPRRLTLEFHATIGGKKAKNSDNATWKAARSYTYYRKPKRSIHITIPADPLLVDGETKLWTETMDDYPKGVRYLRLKSADGRPLSDAASVSLSLAGR